ncbi:MAG: hypothetical protein QXU82_01395 [Candidatus Aenigmatarchaeota archaeon]
MGRLDDLLAEMRGEKKPAPAEIRHGPCGINYDRCGGPYCPGGRAPKEGDDKCAGCEINPFYKGA